MIASGTDRARLSTNGREAPGSLSGQGPVRRLPLEGASLGTRTVLEQPV